VLAVSAKTGRGLKRLVAEALSLADRSAGWIPTPELNRFLGDLQSEREPAAVRGKRLRMYYMSQFETNPPRFAVQVNNRGLVTRDYAYFLENRLRDRYGLQGVPLVIDFKTSRGRS
jgi:GTPase